MAKAKARRTARTTATRPRIGDLRAEIAMLRERVEGAEGRTAAAEEALSREQEAHATTRGQLTEQAQAHEGALGAKDEALAEQRQEHERALGAKDETLGERQREIGTLRERIGALEQECASLEGEKRRLEGELSAEKLRVVQAEAEATKLRGQESEVHLGGVILTLSAGRTMVRSATPDAVTN